MSGDPLKLFAARRKLLNQARESRYAEHCNRLTIDGEFGALFKEKNLVHSELDAVTVHNSTSAPPTDPSNPHPSQDFFLTLTS